MCAMVQQIEEMQQAFTAQLAMMHSQQSAPDPDQVRKRPDAVGG